MAATAYIFSPRVVLWNRTWSPEINFIPFALFFIFYFSRLSFWKREIGLSILAGLLFYVYPYYWTFALALLGVSDLQKFWNQKKIIWNCLYKYLIIGGIAFLYGIHLWQIYQLPYYQETMARIGFLASRLPAGWYTQAVLLASLVLFFGLKKYVFSKINLGVLADGALDKIAAGLVTGLIVLNQQLITNMQMEFNSHYTPIILIFLVAFYGSLLLIFIANLSGAYRKILLSISFLLVAGLIMGRVYSAAANFGGSSYIGSQADEVVRWLMENRIQDKVIYAPENLGDEINLRTNNYLIFNDNQALQLTPTEELIDRFTYFDITNQHITENLLRDQIKIFGHTFFSAMQKDDVINKIKAKILGGDFVPANLADYVKYDFKPMYEKRTNPDINEFNKYLEKYHVNYLIYRQKDRESIYKLAPGKIVFESEEYLIKKRL